ncbi:MAG: hypothetical protein FJ297_03360 [Planctomycetes bacterium]|nr:hypothetical protein [Planctomycetota bacterium]
MITRVGIDVRVSTWSWLGIGIGCLALAELGAAPLAARGEEPRRAGATGGLDAIADAIDRARALAARIRVIEDADPIRLDGLLAELEPLDTRRRELLSESSADPKAIDELGIRVAAVKRRIAFANPRLDFDQLLFIKRHDSVGVYHMCDQYYGCNARPGGGLYALRDPFGPEPRLVNLLENATVRNGRLKGQKLDTGSFLSPELSFDGKTILFAYSEAKAWEKYQGKEAYDWKPEYSFHIFRCNADGSELTQLTDGDWNDFDPCFLPNGRIAFVSERRGGFLRCGRHCPVYTLHSMEPDGSDIVQLSYHETHEWHPSVTNDGMLVYTRWDYVDRDTNIAHHIWTCYPDGRDPRSFHGNYPDRRESRPWMEMAIRAIPGSHKFVASTGAHHGHEFGSLVLIDPHAVDDNASSQLTRITPETPFPEAEGGKASVREHQAYGTPWPLSEDDYLCVYDPKIERRAVYWIDRFGNRERIHGDAEIPCVSPIPLRARPRPPVIADQTMQTARARSSAVEPPSATIAVLNIYDSDFDWPEGTRIDALRVIQVLPKTTAPPNEPRIGVATQTNARAVLGTVPVESDGSAYFEAPAGKELYFQAIDSEGMAVQSMRSGTYAHPGEKLTCQGCHEPKQRSPVRPSIAPLALRRAPSVIAPEAEGSNPFSYVRLVQPVLDRHCVACHTERKAIDLSGSITPTHGWTQSYLALAEKYGFYFHVTNGSIHMGVHGGSRTIPGKFGARGSTLIEYLDERHHGVRLAPEERHRLTLWLDCNSEFFGSYENTDAQSRGQIVRPTLD